MRKKYFLFISLFVLQLSIYAQIDRTRSWVFGQGIGIYFNKSGSIDTIPGIALPDYIQDEGTGVYNDPQGKLLFYIFNGNLFNKKNQKINSDAELGGTNSASQANIITSLNDSLFHIFGSSSGYNFRYSCFDLYNNKFTELGKSIVYRAAETQALVDHQNGKWKWLVCHSRLGDTIFSFLITDNGLISHPVISHAGPSYLQWYSGQGNMKFSPDGSSLIFTTWNFETIEFCKYDNQTGKTTWLFRVGCSGAHDIEFLENYLIVSCPDAKNIVNYSINSISYNEIIKTKSTIYDTTEIRTFGQVQRGPDGNIYVAMDESSKLGKITIENKKPKFNYTPTILGGKKCYLGFPNFNASYFYRPAVNFTYSQNCKNNQFHFLASDTFQATSYFWKFTLNNKQYSDTQYGKSINYTFSDSGIWQVILIAQKGSRSDTMMKNIRIQAPLTSGFLGNDILIPAKSPISGTILAPTPLHCAHWRKINDTTEVTQNQFQFNDTGSIICQLTNTVFCVYTDTISIRVCDSFANMAHIDKSNDTLFTKTYAYKYQWYKNDSAIANSNNPWLKIQTDGQYTLKTYNQQNCDSLSNKFLVVGLNTASIKPNNAISITPNPNNGSFTINSQLSPIQSVEIFDLSGRLVFSNSSNSTDHQLNFHLPLQSGIYCLRINQTNYQLIQILNN